MKAPLMVYHASFSLIFVLLVGGLTSQVTIGPGDMPEAGDFFHFTTSAGVPIGVDPAETGEGMTWDYSTLTPQLNDVDTFLAVSQTPFLYQFYFNNGFLYPDHHADHARKESDLDLGLVTITNMYSYFKNDEIGMRNVGFGANINGIPSSVRNIPVDMIYEFPLEYGDAHTSSSASEVEIPGLGFYSQTQERDVEVEGWGTVILPDTSFEALKIRMILNGSDSVYIEALGTGFAFPRLEQTVYQWLSPGEIEPVLEVTETLGVGALVRYRYTAPSSLAEAYRADIKVYPNPATDFLIVSTDREGLNSYAIYDASGRLVKRDRSVGPDLQVEIPVHSFPQGEYFLLMEQGKQSYYYSFFKN